MPKKAWNISDFSEGINLRNTSKDIEPKGFEYSNNYISFNNGSISSEGLFDEITGLENDVGAFQDNYSHQGTPNLYKVFPELGFRKFGRAKYSDTGAKWKEEGVAFGDHTMAHSLDVGTRVTIIRSDIDMTYRNPNLPNQVGIVSAVISFNEFQLTGLTPGPDDNNEIYYVINGTFNSLSHLTCDPTTNPLENKYLFRATSQGKFGFYNIGLYKSWFGRGLEYPTNAFGNDPWYFDTRYLWDTNQHSSYTPGQTLISDTKVFNASYEDAVFRVMTEAPNGYYGGRCKRPVGLYAIDRVKHRFYENEYVILPGWYALRQHCLAPEEYHRHQDSFYSPQINQEIPNNEFWKGGGTIGVDTNGYTLAHLRTAAQDPTGPAYGDGTSGFKIHQVAAAVAHGEGTSGDEAGDWQFPAGEKHAFLKFGMSFVYDDMDSEVGSESTISVLTNPAGTDSWVDMTSDAPAPDKALIFFWQFYSGQNDFQVNQNWMFAGEAALEKPKVTAVAEFRGSAMNNGYSNHGCWNPRIVGGRIYLLGDFSGHAGESDYREFDEPLYLASFDLNEGALGESHDHIESSPWEEGTVGVWGQKIVIPGVPTLSYELVTSYEHDDSIHAWYQTSAIVNRKLYAGNVSYFDKNETNWEQSKPIHKSDRILISPTNRFDILPSRHYLDVMVGDGQEIVKLQAFNNLLLVFKHDDMFLIDCSGEFEMLTETHYNLGVLNSMQVTKTPSAIYWVNGSGVWGYDGENTISNIIQNKIEIKKWRDEIYNERTFIEYEPKTQMLIVFTRYQGEHYISSPDPANMLLISTETGAVFFKNELAIANMNAIPSGGIVAENTLITATDKGSISNEEYLEIHNTTENIPPTKSHGRWEIEISTESTYDYQFAGNNFKRLMVRDDDTGTETDNWHEINDSNFTLGVPNPDTTNSNQIYQLALLQIDHILQLINSGATANALAKYKWSMGVDVVPDGVDENGYTVKYFIDMQGKVYGTSGNLKDSGSAAALVTLDVGNAVWGTTALAFSSDTTIANIDVPAGELNGFQQLFLINGVAATAGVWKVWINRNGISLEGSSFTFIMALNNYGSEVPTAVTRTIDYITAIDHSNHTYGDGMVNDCNTIGAAIPSTSQLYTNAYNSKKATENLLYLLQNDEELQLQNNFTFSSIADDDGTFTGLVPEDHDDSGTHSYGYFTMTMSDNVASNAITTFYLSSLKTSEAGGKLYSFMPSAQHTSSNTLITKDVDFGQPNVRKKVYRAYVNYKTAAQPANNVTVQYMINGNGSWIDATLKNSSGTVVTSVPASTEWSRFTIEPGSTATNSIYSIKYRIEGYGYVEIDDISIIYRVKPPR